MGAHLGSGSQPRAGSCPHPTYFSALKDLVDYVMAKFKSREVKIFVLWSENQQRCVSCPWAIVPGSGGAGWRSGLGPGRVWNARRENSILPICICSSFRTLRSSSLLALAS